MDYQAVNEVSVEELELNPVVFAFMPDLLEATSQVNEKAAEIKALLGKMKEAFNKLVRSGCKDLNRKLEKFGIPYRFELETANRDNKTASYRLVHIKSSNANDMRNALSFGEKNLITLLLFLQDKDNKIMLIDDPASSYDDYRRTQIFKTVLEVPGKTLLVVSHDQAFVRRAARIQNDKRIGNVDMLCNRSGVAGIEPINNESFVFFEDAIRNRIATASSYYQTMLNARLLCEVRDVNLNDSTLWGYTSAILHQTSRDKILALLKQDGESEENILIRLKELVGESASSNITPLPDTVDYSTSGFSEFERLIAKREDIKAPGGGSALPNGITKSLACDLLDDLVHMNDAMMNCIDPYRYPAWSPVLFRLLEE